MTATVRRNVSQQSTIPADEARRANNQWRQYLVTILVNISTVVTGVIFGWSAPLLPILQSEESSVGIPPLSDSDASWLAPLYTLSRLITIPVYMYAIDRLGCKITGFLVALPFLISYTMLMFANSKIMLFCGRFICGIAAGGTSILVPSYTIDIAEDSNKGKLSVIFAQSMNVGITFSYFMGYYTSYTVFHACCILMTIVFTFIMFWLPESPLFLMTTGKTEQAKEVLKWLRNDKESEFEFERMKIRAEEVLEKRKQKISLSEVMDRRLLRGLFIVLGLTLNQQLTGIGPVEAYTVMIFQQAGAAIAPNISTILLGVLMIIGTHFATVVIERFGRRFLLIVTDVVISLCLFAVGMYFFLQSNGWNMEPVGWLPIVSLLLYILSMGMGIGILPFMIATEMVHPNYRNFVQTANVVVLSVGCFGATVTFIPLANVVGHYGCFWLYAACCAVGTVVIFFTVPETKNRSLEDVLEQLGSDNYIRSVLHYKEKAKEIEKTESVRKSSASQVTENA